MPIDDANRYRLHMRMLGKLADTPDMTSTELADWMRKQEGSRIKGATRSDYAKLARDTLKASRAAQEMEAAPSQPIKTREHASGVGLDADWPKYEYSVIVTYSDGVGESTTRVQVRSDRPLSADEIAAEVSAGQAVQLRRGSPTFPGDTRDASSPRVVSVQVITATIR